MKYLTYGLTDNLQFLHQRKRRHSVALQLVKRTPVQECLPNSSGICKSPCTAQHLEVCRIRGARVLRQVAFKLQNAGTKITSAVGSRAVS